MKAATILVALSISLLAGCSMLGALIPGMGGGTNVAANTQVGKENNQTGVVVGDAIKNDLSAVTELGKLNQAETTIEAHGETTIQNIPPWVLLLLILGWLLPSPKEIWDGLWNIPKKVRGKND
jgi:hypothetical protein